MMMNHAKQRAARRAKNAGAIIFIVAMTLAVLASLGLYALSAASNEIRTSGYERQNTETQYLSEYAILGATQKLGPVEMKNTYDDSRKGAGATNVYNAASLPNHGCYALSGVGASTLYASTQYCKRIQDSQYAAGWANPPVVASTLTAPGSFGAALVYTDFSVEITDLRKGKQPPGNEAGCSIDFTATGVGRVFPGGAAHTWVEYGGVAVALSRAQISVSGINPCPAGN
jgi:hypothetical protein